MEVEILKKLITASLKWEFTDSYKKVYRARKKYMKNTNQPTKIQHLWHD